MEKIFTHYAPCVRSSCHSRHNLFLFAFTVVERWSRIERVKTFVRRTRKINTSTFSLRLPRIPILPFLFRTAPPNLAWFARFSRYQSCSNRNVFHAIAISAYLPVFWHAASGTILSLLQPYLTLRLVPSVDTFTTGICVYDTWLCLAKSININQRIAVI